MNQASFLRLALILSDGQAMTFKKDLLKIVKLVLFENYGLGLTISGIIKKISGKYSLDFADGEIKSAIISASSGEIIETKPSKDPVYFTYAISPNAYEKFQGKNIEDELLPLVEQFLNENPDEDFLPCEELKDIIYRFLYQGFNSDIQTVLALMNYRGEYKQWSIDEKSFSNKEIISLNAFLNWQNQEKNELVFKYVSFCYEYCVMTVKKDKAAYSSIFSGKEFYLDANIIFRLAGFNKTERKDATTAFLNKCRECGVRVNYTNFTNVEIENTLEYHVKLVRNLLGTSAPLSVNAMQQLSSKYANLDFYAQYVEWTKQPQNKIGDYTSFLDDLKRQVARCTASIKFKANETFEQMNTKEKFEEYKKDLTAFKSRRNKGTYEGSIKADVENYMFIQKLTEKSRAISFFDEKFSFITADHTYIDWTREKMAGAIPLFVLPSVWYSIMLKYHGRTDDDYVSFCQFLNQRLTEAPDGFQIKKTQMLAYILGMDESTEIKEEIIFDIGQRLKDATGDFEDIEVFVEESHTKITESKVSQAIECAEETHKRKTEEFLVEAAQQAKNEKDKGFDEGRNQGIKDIIHSQAKQKAKRNRSIHIALSVFTIIFVIAFAVVLVAQYCIGAGATVPILMFIKDNSLILTIVSGAFAVQCILFSRLEKYISWFSTDVQLLEKKLAEKTKKHSEESND